MPASTLSEFRADMTRLVASGEQLLDRVLADVQPRRREVAAIAVDELKSVFSQLQETIEQLIERGKDQVKQYLAEQPSLCNHCLRTLTMTDEQLAGHIAAASRAATWAGWNENEFTNKMQQALTPGDRIEFVGPGAVTVLRKDGATVTIWRRES
jgi:DNA-binding transcriptional regulator YbjK